MPPKKKPVLPKIKSVSKKKKSESKPKDTSANILSYNSCAPKTKNEPCDLSKW